MAAQEGHSPAAIAQMRASTSGKTGPKPGTIIGYLADCVAAGLMHDFDRRV